MEFSGVEILNSQHLRDAAIVCYCHKPERRRYVSCFDCFCTQIVTSTSCMPWDWMGWDGLHNHFEVKSLYHVNRDSRQMNLQTLFRCNNSIRCRVNSSYFADPSCVLNFGRCWFFHLVACLLTKNHHNCFGLSCHVVCIG